MTRPDARRPVSIMLGAAALILGALIVLAYQQWRNQGLAKAQTVLARQTLDSGDALLTDLLDAETGQRGYLLAGNDSYLEPYTRAEQAVSPELAKLQGLLARQSGSAS